MHMIAVMAATVFLGVGQGSGKYATPVGYPGTPFVTDSGTARAVVLDARASRGFVNGTVLSLKGAGIGWQGQFRGNPLIIGPIRVGLGAQSIAFPDSSYLIPTEAYVRIDALHRRHWTSAVLDIGTGTYTGNYVRALYLYGVIRTPTDVHVLMFDQPTVLEYQGLNHHETKLHGIGGEFQLVPLRRVSIAGSLKQFHGTGGALVASHFTVLSSSVSVRAPFHLGAVLSGTHCSDPLGLAFPNNALQLAIGVHF